MCWFNVYVKIHTVVIGADTLNPFWSTSWKFTNIASESRLDIDRCLQVPLSANAYNCNRRSTVLLCKNFVPTNESRCLSRSSTNSSRGSQILSPWFWSPQPSIWLNSCLGHTSSAAHASIVYMAGQEILIYCVFYEILVVYTSVYFGIPCHHDSHTALGKLSQKFGNYVS